MGRRATSGPIELAVDRCQAHNFRSPLADFKTEDIVRFTERKDGRPRRYRNMY